MTRHLLLSWLVILPTSVIVGGATFLMAGQLTDWDLFERIAVAVVLTLVVDVVIAASMAASAPAKVHIGPGERRLDCEIPAEKATIICGFGSSSHGRVLVRGETWQAIRAPTETGALSPDMVVDVVDRDGLTLVISSTPG